ncbi:MAG TPA: protein kinase, partial [Terriglobia bacterium]|nr:protein kinase [Terriglobia bacterium]
MGLLPGSKLGHYEVVAPLGAGGMGEVYRARDSKLGRDVALKVLPEAVARDPERMARFQREAQVLASLNHPNIATIHGLEESGGVRALVMELVEGQTLAEVLEKAKLETRNSKFETGKSKSENGKSDTQLGANFEFRVSSFELLPIAKQIAEALEYAHERGIIHRDLKPANVKITPEGAVKVLDFGLAKALDVDASGMNPASSPTFSPTLSIAATQAGVILGTAAYMSPEQAKGKSADRRADIWAFGCVLYEMLAGKQAFEGESVSEVLAAVIMKDPDWSAVPASTQPAILRMLKRCLEKDPKRRLQAIGEARLVMEHPQDDAAPEAAAGAQPVPQTNSRRALAWGIAGLLLGALIAGVIFKVVTPKAPARGVKHLSITLPPALSLSTLNLAEIAVSPDGSNLVFSARQGDKTQLYERPMKGVEVKPIEGTEGGLAPFFSPDGASVAFVTESPTGLSLRKVALAGGPVQSLCTAHSNTPGSWSSDGTIYFMSSQYQGLASADSAGGNCQDLTKPDTSQGEVAHGLPQLLPDGGSLLFNIFRGFNGDQATIALLSLKSRKWETLLHDGTNPAYVPGGYLVYSHAGSLMAVPFDLSSLKVSGSPVPVLENVMTSSETGTAQFSYGQDGTLAYISGNAAEAGRKIVLVDRDGKSQVLTQNAGAYEDLDLSPDGHRIAMTIEAAAWNIWIYDIPRATLTRFTFENDNRDPLWSPDGKHVVYTSFRNGKFGIYRKPSDGSGSEEQLVSSTDWLTADSFSADGKILAYNAQNGETGFDIWTLPLDGDRKPRSFANTRSNEEFPELSPDGHWLAYESDESGRFEIYVQPFPGPGGKWQISNEGGLRPAWSRDGRELFYISGTRLMAVSIETKPTFTPGTPRALWQGDYFQSGHYYAPLPGGKQFLFIKEIEQPHG